MRFSIQSHYSTSCTHSHNHNEEAARWTRVLSSESVATMTLRRKTQMQDSDICTDCKEMHHHYINDKADEKVPLLLFAQDKLA